jgi:glycine/D-amino acid oxidase-like deaminating enzyme/nitrite reductase/ring-hydroxylating ferredoxin subunit
MRERSSHDFSGGVLPGQPASIWNATEPGTPYERRRVEQPVDVAIVGGGIVGLTAALLLKRAGRTVAVLESRRVAAGVTGCSTAKITSQHGLIYADLINNHGVEKAKAYADANQEAIEQIARIAGSLGIDCDFERKASYAFSRTGTRMKDIEQEHEAASRLGLPASLVNSAPISVPVANALCFDHQAQFHPRKYLLAVAAAVDGDGSFVLENSRVVDVRDDEPCRISGDGFTLDARDVIVATNLPILDRGGFFARAYPRAHIGIAAPIGSEAAPEGMFLCMDDAPHSVRTWRNGAETYLIVLSASFTPGETENVVGLFQQLATETQRDFPIRAIEYRWMTEDYESMDGLPFVGKLTPISKHLFTATGFSAWGISNGTAAAHLLADTILERESATASLYNSTRVKAAGATKFLRKNLSVGTHWIGGVVSRGEQRGSDDLRPGEGAVIEASGKKRAVYKDDEGKIHSWSPYCSHLGCLLAWNNFARTWDCSCHGSRFERDGRVLHGPATKDMEPGSESPPVGSG